LNSSVTAKKWYVAVDNDHLGGNGWVAYASGTVTGSSFTYTIPNVPAGTYFVYCAVDINGLWATDDAGPWAKGDYVATWGNNTTAPSFTVPSTGVVTADMTTYIDTTNTVGATVTGTVTLSGSVMGKKWFVAIDSDMIGDNGWIADITGTVTGDTFTYTIQDVPAGTYYLYTVVDVANTWGTEPAGAAASGDYIAFYGTDLTAPNFTVPSSGVITANLTTAVY
jgi:uncharacterized protein (DUF2141 family)